MKNTFRHLLIFALSAQLFACKINKSLPLSAVLQVKAIPTYTKPTEVDDNFQLDAMVYSNSGINSKTSGLEGTYSWNKLKVEVKNGSFKNGIVYFNRNTFNNDTVFVKVSSKKTPSACDSFSLIIPKVTNIELFSNNTFLSSGPKVDLDCRFYFSSGKQFSSTQYPFLLNLIQFKNNTIEISNQSLYWTSYFSNNFHPSVQLEAYAIHDYNIKDTISKTINYVQDFKIEMNGNDGQDGQTGYNGRDGSSSDNKNGTDGSDGTHGSPGDNADNIDVNIKSIVYENDVYWKLEVENYSTKRFLWLNMSKGSTVTIIAKGGKGGNGGNGGIGGYGLDVSDQNKTAGAGGNGGNGGAGGRGGDGGNIKITCDSIAIKYLDKISHFNEGGAAGSPGASGSKGKGGYDPYKKNTIWNILFPPGNGVSGNTGQSQGNGRNGKFRIEIKKD
jgi:hypothetical protein